MPGRTPIKRLPYMYRDPSSLGTMRLLKTAGDLGEPQTAEELRRGLVSELEQRSDLADQEKAALIHAARSLTEDTYRFTVRRISGSEPSFIIRQDGRILIDIAVAETPGDVVGRIFGLSPLNQVDKVIEDNVGVFPDLDMGSPEVPSSEDIRFDLRREPILSATPYQRALERILIDDPGFSDWEIADHSDGVILTGVKLLLARRESDDFVARANVYLDHDEQTPEGAQARLRDLSAELETSRRARFHQYLASIGLPRSGVGPALDRAS